MLGNLLGAINRHGLVRQIVKLLSNFEVRPVKLRCYISYTFSLITFSGKVKPAGIFKYFLSYEHVIDELFDGLSIFITLSLLLLLVLPKLVKILSVFDVIYPYI